MFDLCKSISGIVVARQMFKSLDAAEPRFKTVSPANGGYANRGIKKVVNGYLLQYTKARHEELTTPRLKSTSDAGTIYRLQRFTRLNRKRLKCQI
jgi:hypothetical protein